MEALRGLGLSLVGRRDCNFARGGLSEAMRAGNHKKAIFMCGVAQSGQEALSNPWEWKAVKLECTCSCSVVCVCVYADKQRALGGQTRALDPLELELQAVVRHLR